MTREIGQYTEIEFSDPAEVAVERSELIALLAVAEAAQQVAASTGAGWHFTDALTALRDALELLDKRD